jgi:tetratricopeptide (TPR) repeat protein
MTIIPYDSGNVWVVKGEIHWNNGDYEIAKKCFSKAIDILPNSLYARFCKAAILWKMGDSCESEKIFAEIEIDIEKLNVPGRLKDGKKPIQTVFPDHNPYLQIASVITPEEPTHLGLQKYTEENIHFIKQLIHDLRDPQLKKAIQYESSDFQRAYLLLYFPYYIETLYHELCALKKTGVLEGLTDHMSVNICGCGPAPEFFGLLAYVSSNIPEVKHLTTYFYDRKYWSEKRQNSFEIFSPIYNKNCDLIIENLEPHCEDLIDVFQKAEDYPQIRNADIHVFQHSFRELLHRKGESLFHLLNHFIKNMKHGSIIIIIENYYYTDIKELEKYSTDLESKGVVKILRKSSDKWTYPQPNKNKMPPFLWDFFVEVEKKQYSITYSSTVLLKV